MTKSHIGEGQVRGSWSGRRPPAGRRRTSKPRLERLEVRCLPGFLAPLAYAAGGLPVSVAVGDFNGDGKLDLAVVNYWINNVSVLLGKGDGTFLPAGSSDTGYHPLCVAVGDFNGDGKPDLAVANYSYPFTNGSVSVVLGNGDGTFQPALNFLAGSGPCSVAVGDFNGDGLLDLAVANSSDYYGNRSGVSVLLGNGDGTFQPALNYAAGSEFTAVAVGDFNGDGKQDLAVANSNYLYTNGSVSVLLGQGDGTFQFAGSYAAGYYPHSVAVGDFNNDGIFDLAVANYLTNSVSVLLGKGDGTFQPAVNYPTGPSPSSVAVGDFNGDGKLDLAVANAGSWPFFSDGSVSVLLGKGDGTFQATVNYAAGTRPSSVAVGDFNGDGFPDLAVANFGSNDVSILLNDATWSMSPTGAADRRVDSGPKGPAPPSLSLAVAVVAASAAGQPPGMAPREAAPPAPGLAPGLVDALFAAPRGEEPARAAPGLVLARHASLSHGRWQPLFDDLDLPGQARAPLPWEEL
jgi:hypothetical protein